MTNRRFSRQKSASNIATTSWRRSKPPGPEAEKAAAGHGGVEQAREHYTAEKKQATNQLNYSRNNLSSAFLAAGRDAANQSPEANAILDQIAERRQQQAKILRQYKDEKLAQVESIMPDLYAGQEGEKVGDEVASGQEVKSALKQSAAVETNAGTHLKVAELDLRRKMGQASYQLYQENVQMAAQEFKMRPQIIEDPAKREQGVALKQRMDEVKAKIAHYDKEIDQLEQGGLGARLRSLASGGVEGRKEFYAQKKADAGELLQSLEHELDQVALDAVSDQTKLDLLNDAKTVAQENKERQKPSVRDALHQKEEGSQHDHDVSDDKSLRRSWQSSKVDKPSGGPALRSSSP